MIFKKKTVNKLGIDTDFLHLMKISTAYRAPWFSASCYLGSAILLKLSLTVINSPLDTNIALK